MQAGPEIRCGVLAVALVVLACWLSSGCGPIGYVNQVTRKASASVAAARDVKADEYSPYWYTLAVEYLHQARREAALADFQAANRFGRQSHEAAERARKEAIERAANPGDTSWMPPESLRSREPAGSSPRGDESGKGAGQDAGEGDEPLAPADSGLAPVIAPDAKPGPESGASETGKSGKTGKTGKQDEK